MPEQSPQNLDSMVSTIPMDVKQFIKPVGTHVNANNETPVISVIGLGYVGAVTSACFSKLGYPVIGVDQDKRKVDNINQGTSPIYEEGLDKYIKSGIDNNTLSASDDIAYAIENSDVSIISVGTPSDESGACSLIYLEQVCKSIGLALQHKISFHTIIFKSTVPPKTTEEKLVPIVENYSHKIRGKDFGVCFNPEFLRESTAIEDFHQPPITLIGAIDKRSADIASNLFSKVDAKIEITDMATAEFVKYIDNTWHANKVCFANEVGRLCRALSVDSHRVMDIFVQDTKLNISPYYLKPGFAFGGSCLPKDTRGIKHLADTLDIDVPLINGINQSNEAHIEHVVNMVIESGEKHIGICGITFKAGTDDMRESPNLTLMNRLMELNLNVTFFDPLVSGQYRFSQNEVLNEKIHTCRSVNLNEFVRNSTLIILAHNDEYTELACQLATEDHTVIDLIRSKSIQNCKAHYQGICW